MVHRSDRYGERRAASFQPVAALLVLVALALAAGCSKSDKLGASFNIVCEQNGLCECTSNDQCAAGEICFNGWCRALEVEEDVTPTDAPAPPDLHTDTFIEPGAFKSPCETDEDCDSGICLEVSTGVKVCTQECIDDCPEDWECRGVSLQGSLVTFLCFPPLDRLCQPCKTDVACTGGANLCLDVGGVLSCGRDCSQVACPNGYSCEDVVSVEGKSGQQCVPESGHCQCVPENVGKSFACSIDNEFGSCPGQQICLEDGAMGPCDAQEPEEEACDGKDNDCDGFIDEEVALGTCTVENEHGICEGDRLCLPGVGESCNASIPKPEVCDTLDNDCNDGVDEDFKTEDGKYGLLDHCGQCGNSCFGKFAHALEIACDTSLETPKCKLVKCEPGFVLAQGSLCLPPIHHLCEPCTSHEACVGANDKCLQMNPADTQTFCGRDCAPGNEYGIDCPEGYECTEVDVDGEVAEQCVPVNKTCDCSELSAGQIKPCQSANEAGTCYGVATCDPELGWGNCSAKTPAVEVCDGFDNDCDGIVDEELSGPACEKSNEAGTCVGTTVCMGQDGSLCTAPTPAPDLCDGKDNDCDGTVDQAYATSLYGEDGELVALVYDLSDDHCGGCGIPCVAKAPALQAHCDSDGGVAYCRVLACQPGFYVYQNKACLPMPKANLCLPCGDDEDCLGPADECIAYGNGLFCGRDCSEGSMYSVGGPGDAGYCTGAEGEQGCCPLGYLCAGGQCVRESSDCHCDVTGKLRPCQESNDFGTCGGFQTCIAQGPGAGWQPCSAEPPSQEVCDGIDNDCDGLVDALDADISTQGLEGYPGCSNVSEACSGDWLCAQINGFYQWSCTAPSPVDEICNGVDDDCDGDADEGYTSPDGSYTLLEHCGHCGLDCRLALAHLAHDGQGEVLPDAVSCAQVLGSPTCVPEQCEPGYYLFPPGNPSICLGLQEANCQPCVVAGDCPGVGHACLPVGTDSGAYCLSRCDAASPFPGCTGAVGEQDCCPDGLVCSAIPGGDPGTLHCLPETATCQCHAGNAGFTRPCTVTGDEAQTCFGLSECKAIGGGLYAWSDCDTSANVEVCDGQDNDCDGVVDDGFLTNGLYADDQHCGACGKNCLVKWSASKQHAIGACDEALPGGPDCVIGECLSRLVGGGTPCAEDADCAGNAAGSSCLADFHQCGSLCTADNQCPGGACVDGSCAPDCANDAACAAFGEAAFCSAGHCVTSYAWVNLDGWTGNGCECAATEGLAVDEPDRFDGYPLPGAHYADRDCDGIDGDLESALFVISGLPGGDGSYGAPFGTIQAAVNAFEPGVHSHVLVSAGTYPEQVELTNGVRVYGGYSDDFLERDIVLYPSVIQGFVPDFAAPGWKPGVVRATDITEETVLAGFTIVGYDVPGTGASAGRDSVAVYVASASNALVLTNNYILAGSGGMGVAGAAGPGGANGGSGGNGLHSAECINGVTCVGGTCNEKSCSGHSQPGGGGGQPGAGCAGSACGSAGCPGMEAEGAESPQVADNPPAGCTYPLGAYSATYSGGPWNHCKYDCYVSSNMVGDKGSDGTSGSGGTGGTGGSPSGSFATGSWISAAGQAGAPGTGGTRGGGGSSGAYISNNKASNCTIGEPYGDLGGSGGGGGAGGNGGSGGQPGGNGGGSVAVLLLQPLAGSHASVIGNIVVRGNGGDGGDGGNGGTGGNGGAGGFGGGAGWPAWCAGVGGPGGRGGDGGPGGGGGGGSGGPAYAIAVVNGAAAPFSANNLFPLGDGVATGGNGGSGGLSLAPATTGQPGSNGSSKNVEVF